MIHSNRVFANSVFLPRRTFYKFFFRGKLPQNLLWLFFRASQNFLGQVDIEVHLPDGQVVKKVNFDPCCRLNFMLLFGAEQSAPKGNCKNRKFGF